MTFDRQAFIAKDHVFCYVLDYYNCVMYPPKHTCVPIYPLNILIHVFTKIVTRVQTSY